MRRISPILLVAFGVDLAFGVAHLVQRLTLTRDHYFDGVDRWGMAGSGVWAMFAVMVGVGLFDLAGRLTGRAAVGARVAGIAVFASFALGMTVNILNIFDLLPHEQWVWQVDQYLFWAIWTIAAVGLLLASPARLLAIAAFAVCMLVHPPPFLGEVMFKGFGILGAEILYGGLALAHTAAMLVLVSDASDGAAPQRHDLAVKGFDRAAGALWLRVVAAAFAMMFGLMSAASAANGSFAIMKFTMIGGLVINLASFLVFGLGALDVARSALDGVARYAVAIAGAASLWCAGVMLGQIPYLYQVLYGHESFASSHQEERMQALTVAMPLVGTLSCAIFAGVMAAFARARGDEALAGRASSAGTTYVLLMLASIGIQSFLFEKATSLSGMIGMMLVAAGCALAAQMILSKVCRAASFSLESAPGLPTAVAKINDPT